MDEAFGPLVRKGDYIYGSFVKPASIDGYINGVNPGHRDDVLGRFPFSESSVDDAIEHARRAAREWTRTGINDRAHAVRRFRDTLARYRQRVAGLVTRETGKPLWESRREVHEALEAIDLLLDDGLGLLAPQVLNEHHRTDLVPRGVVAAVCPYNLPVATTAVQVSAGVLAGNTVVYKPSKFTPAVGQMLAELWDRCRVPRGVVNLVQGSGSVVGKRLSTHPDIDALLVTGSFNTAMAIRRAVFDRPELPVHYQAGGKGLAIVLPDADLDHAVYAALYGALLTAGQRHTSTGRIIVLSSVWDTFIERLLEHANRVKVGYGFDSDIFMGPLISEKFRSRFRKYGRALSKRGHNALLPGTSRSHAPRRGFYVTPAIYEVDWRGPHPFLNEEPPGPTVLVYKVDTVEEAAALHNQAMYRMVCSIFGDASSEAFTQLSARVRTGRLRVNRPTTDQSPRLASVGLGRSSDGHPSGLGLLRAVCYPRATLSGPTDLRGEHAPGMPDVDEDTFSMRLEITDEISVTTTN